MSFLWAKITIHMCNTDCASSGAKLKVVVMVVMVVVPFASGCGACKNEAKHSGMPALMHCSLRNRMDSQCAFNSEFIVSFLSKKTFVLLFNFFLVWLVAMVAFQHLPCIPFLFFSSDHLPLAYRMSRDRPRGCPRCANAE